MKPYILNPEGYSLVPDLDLTKKHGRQWYQFHQNLAKPVSFFDGERLWETNRNFPTDLGSIPDCFEWIPGFHRNDNEITYVFHDNGCNAGGLWTGGKFVTLTRPQVDSMLKMMVPVEARLKCRPIAAVMTPFPIWCGVRAGAQFGAGVPKK